MMEPFKLLQIVILVEVLHTRKKNSEAHQNNKSHFLILDWYFNVSYPFIFLGFLLFGDFEILFELSAQFVLILLILCLERIKISLINLRAILHDSLLAYIYGAPNEFILNSRTKNREIHSKWTSLAVSIWPNLILA